VIDWRAEAVDFGPGPAAHTARCLNNHERHTRLAEFASGCKARRAGADNNDIGVCGQPLYDDWWRTRGRNAGNEDSSRQIGRRLFIWRTKRVAGSGLFFLFA
jgi:hypothetical protein